MKFDAAVIGASTAGLYSAALLAEAGKQVGVFEKGSKGQFDRRTYIVTKGLERVMPELDPGLVLNTITSMQVEALDAVADIRLAKPDLVVERSQLRKHLIDRAEKAGAALFWEARFEGMADRSGVPGVRINQRGSEEWIDTDVLIGADGIESDVRKSVNLAPVPYEPLLQAEVTLPMDWSPEVTKVWFDTQTTPYFYWLIPESEHKGVVGLIAETGSDIGKLLNDFLEEHGFQAIEYQSGKAAMHLPDLVTQTEVSGMHTYFVGDAAGQVKVTTVGGTVTGFRGARAVVECILAQQPYQKAIRALKRELDLHVFIRDLLERMDDHGYQRLIEAMTPAVQDFLGQYDRDAMRGQFWKLALLQPRFIPLGLRLLFSRKKPIPR